jgi:DNA modification methylase
MEIQQIKINQLIEYKNNAKKHDEAQIKNVMQSIKEFGMVQPIVIDQNNTIIIGHCRFRALKRLKWEEVPCVRIENLSEKDINKLRLLDNKLNESEWDFDLLFDQIGTIDWNDFDIDWGLDDFLKGDEKSEIIEDEAPDVEDTSISQVGDIYILGKHRLICGDSTDENIIKQLMNNEHADLLLTDPPYGINVVSVDKKIGSDKPFGSKGKVGYGEKGKNKIIDCNEYAPIIGDNTTETAKKSYELLKKYTKNQIIFGGNYFTDFLKPSRCWLVWDKENTGNFADAELAWTSFETGVKLYKFMWNGLCREGSRKVEGKKRIHPTQKPVGMLADILKDFSKENDNIVDAFGGSGSTLLACEQLNRRCFMCELDEHYVDVIVKRYIDFTNNKNDVYLIRDGQKIKYKDLKA